MSYTHFLGLKLKSPKTLSSNTNSSPKGYLYEFKRLLSNKKKKNSLYSPQKGITSFRYRSLRGLTYKRRKDGTWDTNKLYFDEYSSLRRKKTFDYRFELYWKDKDVSKTHLGEF